MCKSLMVRFECLWSYSDFFKIGQFLRGVWRGLGIEWAVERCVNHMYNVLLNRVVIFVITNTPT